MAQAKQLPSWIVSLHSRVIARMTLAPQFGGNVDLAVEAARSADLSGQWVAVKDPTCVLNVRNESAIEDLTVVSCRPTGMHNWDVVVEAAVRVRATVTVQATTAHEAKSVAEIESVPLSWSVFADDSAPGPKLEIASEDLLESVHANNVIPV